MKRRYTRLADDQWAEAETAWASGSATLPELAHRFAVTERGLQARFAKRGIEKGQSAKALAVQVAARVMEEQAAQVETLAERAQTIREVTYSNAAKVERAIMDRLDAAAADPSQTFAAAAAIKMLTNAAAALERLHSLKRSALGISDDDVSDDEMPVLLIRDMTRGEIEDMRRKQDEEDALDGTLIDVTSDAVSFIDDEDLVREGEDKNDDL
ncbi:hypothetical protein [Methylobacterium sp. 37f]|uniref:hypothetical protein n=1 Tax=Methylobacterium sp. 37f TaxID=2817058 RepID=UPI001FFCC110|nr:hypothetical protein [Methylobacterium sp. 37f]MCK2057195.1 hypothetical protein [Methylobacterium sp. 37f]